jgi:hypothetical protein
MNKQNSLKKIMEIIHRTSKIATKKRGGGGLVRGMELTSLTHRSAFGSRPSVNMIPRALPSSPAPKINSQSFFIPKKERKKLNKELSYYTQGL